MLLLIIPTAWLAIATLVLVACRAAARGDNVLTATAASASPEAPGRVTVHQRTRWQDASPRGEVRMGAARAGSRTRPPVRGTRCAGHVSRG